MSKLFKNVYLLAGIVMLATFLSVPMYNMLAFTASIHGWHYALIALAKCAGYGVGIGCALALIMFGAGKVGTSS